MTRETALGAALLRAMAVKPTPPVVIVEAEPPPPPVPAPLPPALVVIDVTSTVIPAAARQWGNPPPDPAETLAQALEAIRDRVRRNEPRHRDPERFHEEKSEICGDISRMVSDLRKGRAAPRGRKDAQG